MGGWVGGGEGRKELGVMLCVMEQGRTGSPCSNGSCSSTWGWLMGCEGERGVGSSGAGGGLKALQCFLWGFSLRIGGERRAACTGDGWMGWMDGMAMLSPAPC